MANDVPTMEARISNKYTDTGIVVTLFMPARSPMPTITTPETTANMDTKTGSVANYNVMWNTNGSNPWCTTLYLDIAYQNMIIKQRINSTRTMLLLEYSITTTYINISSPIIAHQVY